MKKLQSNVIFGPWETAISYDSPADQMNGGPSLSSAYADKKNGAKGSPKEKKEGKKDEENKSLKEDLKALTRTALRARYKREYSSWSNMKNRCKGGSGVLDPEFSEFRSFLSYMGPKPADSYSLDRIDYTNPEYGPGNCRWASKTTQTRNRSNTVLLKGPGGDIRPLAEWAKLLQVSEKTLYNRRSKGWADLEVLYGRRSASNHAGTASASEPAHSEWQRLAPGYNPARLEQRYRETRHRLPVVTQLPVYESRHGWLLRYSSEMMSRAKEQIVTSMGTPDDDPDPHHQSLYEHFLELWRAASRTPKAD